MNHPNASGKLSSHIADPFDHVGFIGVLDRSSEREQEIAGIASLAAGDHRAIGSLAHDIAYYAFANGYGAGVALGSAQFPACAACAAIGDGEHVYEMAVLHGPARHTCYATPLTNDVLCPLTSTGVRSCLDQIAALPPKKRCTHKAPSPHSMLRR